MWIIVYAPLVYASVDDDDDDDKRTRVQTLDDIIFVFVFFTHA